MTDISNLGISAIERDEVLVSVVMPAWNRSNTIREAILSIRNDRSRPRELIIVDDGSTDDTAAVISELIATSDAGDWIRLIRQKNGGPAAARNNGARHARGRYIAFMDSDDLWFAWTLDVCERVAAARQTDLVFLPALDFQTGKELSAVHNADPRTRTFDSFLAGVSANRSYRFSSCNVMISRASFNALGGFDEGMRCSEDSDLFLRSNGTLRAMLIDAPFLVGHRMGSADQLTGNFDCVLKGYARMRENYRAGFYACPGQERQMERFLAGSAVRAVRTCLAFGPTSRAYGVLIDALPLIIRAGLWDRALKLALTPVLTRIKPASFPFRLKRP
jgi:Glycosyl transferase family 2